MKLNQALKQKSRMAGELVRLQTILSRENSRRNDNPSTVDASGVWQKILDLTNSLAEFKGKITVANIGIYPKLERMAELKARIAYLSTLPKREGTEQEQHGYNQSPVSYTWTAFITQAKADELIAGIQSQINDAQDLIDDYNNKTDLL